MPPRSAAISSALATAPFMPSGPGAVVSLFTRSSRKVRSVVPGTKVVMLEQDPAVAGFATLEDYVLSGSAARKSARSASSAGWNSQSVGPPTRSQVRSASGRSGDRFAVFR